MKYLLKVLSILLVILFSLKLIMHIFDNGHKVSYTIGNFNISEDLTVNALDRKDNYYFTFKHEKFKFSFQIFKEYNKSENIIKDVRYYDAGEYQCVLPIFKGTRILTDIMCVKGNEISYYHDLKNKNVEIDKFARSLSKYGYDLDLYEDKTLESNNSNGQAVYEENLVDNHYLAIENYRGLTLINSEVRKIKLFNNDVYKKPVSLFTDKYYIVADYNSEYTFKNFYVVNIVNGNIKEIRSYDEISFDSIMQGAVGKDIYLFDKDSKTQYKISLKYETVEKVNGEIKHYDGAWTVMSLMDALNGKKFANNYSDKVNGYDKVDYIGGKQAGYYYLFKRANDKYFVYRADKQNIDVITYLFTTTDLDSLIYVDNYVYFKNGTSWSYYSDYGVRKVISNSELEFNDDITLGVYIK